MTEVFVVWWVFWSFIALFIAFILYDKIEEDIPEELDFVKLGTSDDYSGQAPIIPIDAQTLEKYLQGWRVTQTAQGLQAERNFITPIQSDGVQFDPPVFYFSCYQGTPFVWVDTRLRATDSAKDPSRVNFNLGGISLNWPRGPGKTIVSTAPLETMASLQKTGYLDFQLPFDEAPRQSLRVEGPGLNIILNAVPSTCRPASTGTSSKPGLK